MLQEFNIFNFTDKSGKGNKLTAEVNWATNEDIKNCKTIRFNLNGEECFVDRNELNTFLFSIGTDEDQVKMIPQRLTTTRHYETILTIKAMNDIKKGESINVPVSIKLPSQEKEVISEIASKLKNVKVLKK